MTPPTAFEVRAFDVPDSASTGDAVTATLTVANVGDADGTFVAALDWRNGNLSRTTTVTSEQGQ